MKRWLKRILYFLLSVVVILNIYIVVTGQFHVYKAVYYNFENIDDWKIFENRKVATEKPEDLPKHVLYNTQKIPEDCADWMKKYETVAFLAIKNDSVIHEEYYRNYGPSSVSSSFSMAKSIVSILVGIAIDEGKIKSVDEPVSHYLEDFNEGLKAKLTIKNLLQMSAGFDFEESYIDPFSLTTESYYGSDLKGLSKRIGIKVEPGKVYNYQSCNQIFLQQILEKATGKKLSDYLSEKLWKPLHANHDASWSLDHEGGDEKAFCCVNSNARDFGRLGLLYMHQGNWKGTQVVSKSWVEESIKPASILDKEGKPCDFYGLSWWLTQVEHQGKKHSVYYMRGVLGQYVLVIPDYNLVVVRLGEQRSSTLIGEHRTDIYKYMEAVLNMYCK